MTNKNLSKKKIYNKASLKKILNIDLDFLIIDEFCLLNKFKKGVGKFNFNKSKSYYKAHFINNPTMPGTLQTEAMLQTIVCIMYTSDNKINNCLITKYKLSFLQKINKSQNLTVTAKIKLIRRGLVNAEAIIANNKKKYSYGEFNFIIPNQFKLKTKN